MVTLKAAVAAPQWLWMDGAKVTQHIRRHRHLAKIGQDTTVEHWLGFLFFFPLPALATPTCRLRGIQGVKRTALFGARLAGCGRGLVSQAEATLEL